MQHRLKTKEAYTSVIITIILAYVFLKIYRNSINYTDTTQGGIWNVFLVFLMFLGIISIVRYKFILSVGPTTVAFIYTFVVWLNGILTFSIKDLSSAYGLIVAPCFAVIFILIYNCADGFSEKTMNYWFLGWFFILLLLLYTYISFFSQYQYYESGEHIALNNSYYAACVMPFFIRKKNFKGLSLTLLSALVVFISNKRAGVIAIFLAFICYYYCDSKLKGTSGKALKSIVGGFIALCILSIFFIRIDSKYNLNIYNRLFQLVKDGGSGRVTIYQFVWNEIKNSSLYELMFGHGVYSIGNMEIQISSAHSDFLNILYEFGIFAFIFLIQFYFSLFKIFKRMMISKYKHSAEFAFSIVVSLIFSFFSANLDNQSFSIVLATYWAFEQSQWNKTLSIDSATNM